MKASNKGRGGRITKRADELLNALAALKFDGNRAMAWRHVVKTAYLAHKVSGVPGANPG